jgi:hypothetical protein
MENRDKNLMSLRITLNLNKATGEIEQFQNDTLRPIFKFQNELILQICHSQFVKRKGLFFRLAEPEQLKYIEQQISRDQHFKNLLFGIIVGHFTSEDWQFFKKNEQNLKKRMTSLLIKRIQSQFSLLTSDLN